MKILAYLPYYTGKLWEHHGENYWAQQYRKRQLQRHTASREGINNTSINTYINININISININVNKGISTSIGIIIIDSSVDEITQV